MSEELIHELQRHGATQGQLVTLTSEGPRTLRYIDLLREPAAERPALVLESQGQPRAYVYDARTPQAVNIMPWIRRIAFRGDADYIALVRPGCLDILPASLGIDEIPPQLDLPEGPLCIPTLLHMPPSGVATPVRQALRDLLRLSIQNAIVLGKDAGVDAHDALSLVGRALFWRFLIDRNLLHGLDPSEICGDPQVYTAEECLTKKGRALKTFAWLDRTFNGGLLRLRTKGRAAEIPATVYTQVVGNIAHAAKADGQLQLKLPTDWREVNFAHVPVGLLSEVYEAFAHTEDVEVAKRDSIFYTPRHIAEFMVEEALQTLDSVKQPKVLDPAAGAGVFLVAVFRALVAREWNRTGRRPSRRTVRRILSNQLFGFDINDAALRLTELALYLTAIELDPDRAPRPLSLLKFARPLRDNSLFQRSGGASRGSLDRVEPDFRGRFDLVIGNPPWSGKVATTADKNRWLDDTRVLANERLGKLRASTLVFPDTYPDIPFLYRSMEWARPDGQIALLTHARWLFPGDVRTAARRDLLDSFQVTGIVNGASLRRPTVWPRIEAPFAIVFAVNTPPTGDAAFQFITPRLLPNAPGRPNRLRIDWSDAHLVRTQDALKKPYLLKLRFRGTAFDEVTLQDLITRGPTLETYLKSIGTYIRNGYQLASRKSPSRLIGLPNLTAHKERVDASTNLGREGPQQSSHNRRSSGFLLETSKLDAFSHGKVHLEPTLDECASPLLLVTKSPPVDPTLPRTSISLSPVAFSQSWHGASLASVENGLATARWLQIAIQSSSFLYFALLTDGWFGVERDHYTLETVKQFPVVPYSDLDSQQRRNISQLSNALWTNGWSPELEQEINDLVFEAYGLDDIARDSVTDTLATSLPYANQRHNAMRCPSAEEVLRFASELQEEMRGVLESSGHCVHVRHRDDLQQGPWILFQIDEVRDSKPAKPNVAIPWSEILTKADELGSTLVVTRASKNTTIVATLKHYRYLTVTRARALALSLLSVSGT